MRRLMPFLLAFGVTVSGVAGCEPDDDAEDAAEEVGDEVEDAAE